jgi:hypothetical protein
MLLLPGTRDGGIEIERASDDEVCIKSGAKTRRDSKLPAPGDISVGVYQALLPQTGYPDGPVVVCYKLQ